MLLVKVAQLQRQRAVGTCQADSVTRAETAHRVFRIEHSRQCGLLMQRIIGQASMKLRVYDLPLDTHQVRREQRSRQHIGQLGDTGWKACRAHTEKEPGGFCGCASVKTSCTAAHECRERAGLGIPLRAHKQHVLQQVRQAGLVGGFVVATRVYLGHAGSKTGAGVADQQAAQAIGMLIKPMVTTVIGSISQWDTMHGGGAPGQATGGHGRPE